MGIEIYQGDNLDILQMLYDRCERYDLIYIDPPFNTGKSQKRGEISYKDKFESLTDYLRPRMELAYNLLRFSGTLFFHIDYREVHNCRFMLDEIFGKENFVNEIIWAYDYGGRSKTRWSAKHDNILFYAKDYNLYPFNYDEVKRIPYMAPGLVGEEKAEKGKPETDVWWNTIVPTNSKENLHYPTQKPEALLERIIRVVTYEGDNVLDFFAGSGTTGAVCKRLNRNCTLIDNNEKAIEIMKERLL